MSHSLPNSNKHKDRKQEQISIQCLHTALLESVDVPYSDDRKGQDPSSHHQQDHGEMDKGIRTGTISSMN